MVAPSSPASNCPFCKKKENPCAFCEKAGLPILPLRYAVARRDLGGKAPEISAPFGAGVGDVALPSKDAIYTLRLLRAGYLYVFNEKRGTWNAYVVTKDAYLFEFDIHSPTPPDVQEVLFNCSREGDAYLARCVCIPSADKAGAVWFGFSDSAWTPAVLARHSSAEYRAKHMRKIDVGQWLKGQSSQAHAAPFNELSSRVAEYAIGAAPPPNTSVQPVSSPNTLPGVTVYGSRSCGYSPFDFHVQGQHSADMVAWAERACSTHKPMLLGLTDAVGIAAELAQLMQVRTNAFINDVKKDKDRTRKLALSGLIMQMRDAIKNQAELAEIDAGDKLAQDAEYGTMTPGGFPTFPQPGMAKKYRDILTPEHLQKVGNDEWAKYTDKYNEPARLDFQRKFDQDLADFDAQTIFPLAQAHVAWMRGGALKEQLTCNADPLDIWSGLGYVQSLLMCIDNTSDKKPCADLYAQWLALNDTSDQNNVVLRALMLNQDKLAKPIADAAKSSLDPRIVPWDNLIGVYKAAAEKLAEGHRSIIGDLIVQLGGPFGKIADKLIAAGQGPGMAALIALGVLQERPIVRVAVTGGRKAFRAMLIRQLMRSYGSKLSQRDMERAVSTELRRMQISGAKLDGTDKKNWLLIVDENAVKGMPSNLTSSQERANWLAGSLRTVEQLEEATSKSWQKIVNSGVRIGLVAGLLQVWSLTKLVNDEATAMSNERTESKWRMYAGVGALAATMSEVAAKGLEGLAHVPSISARAAYFIGWKPFLEGLGRFGGAAVGIVMAAWDGIKAWESYSQKNYKMMGLYISSVLIGIAVTVGFLLAWTGPIMFILVAALIITAILIELFKDNKLMEWLKRCYWGTDIDEIYSEDEEKKQLQIAIQG